MFTLRFTNHFILSVISVNYYMNVDYLLLELNELSLYEFSSWFPKLSNCSSNLI